MFSFICSTIVKDIFALNRLIASFADYSSKFDELVILNQSEIEIKTPTCQYQNIRIFVYNEQKGLSIGRNFSFRYITNNYVGFLDDDCYLSESYLNNLRLTAEALSPDVILGSYKDPLTSEYCNCIRNIKSNRYVTSNQAIRFPSISLVVKKELLDKLLNRENYLFNEKLGVGTYFGSSEETELIARLTNYTSRFYYSNEIYLFHKIEKSYTNYNKTLIYSRGIGALLRVKNARNKCSFRFSLLYIVKSMIGYFLFICNKIRRTYYKNRIIGYIEGFFNYGKR